MTFSPSAAMIVLLKPLIVAGVLFKNNKDWDSISYLLLYFRAGLKGMMVLLPLLGLTWVFGIMAISKDTIAFQYLFALFNSSQVRR